MFDIRNQEILQIQERRVWILEQMQIPKGTRQVVRRNERHLLANRNRCKCCMLPEFGKKVKIGDNIQFGNKFTR